MAKKSYSEDLKLSIVNSVRNGRSMRAAAKEYGVPKSIVTKICSKYDKMCLVSHKSGAGRPRKMTQKDDQTLTRLVKRDSLKTASHVGNQARKYLSVRITTRTARNILK